MNKLLLETLDSKKEYPNPANHFNFLYIRGWKGLAAFTGFSIRTLQRWHYERARLPFIKTHAHSTRSRWIITPDRVHLWLTILGKKLS